MTELVVLRGRLWVAPIDPHGLRCVARTTTGRQCRNSLEYERVLSQLEVQLGEVGYVHAYVTFGPNRDEEGRWLAQHCTVHDTPTAVNIASTELRAFRLDTDGRLVRRYRHDALVD